MMIDPDWSSTILSKVEIKEDLPAPVLPTIPTWGGEKFFRDLGFFWGHSGQQVLESPVA